MATTERILTANRHLFCSVPRYASGEVCGICRGPVQEYACCYGCKRLRDAASFPLAGRVVPMTVAPNPGAWYTRLATYKTFHPQHRALLASLAYEFLTAHETRIADALGGELDCITLVPSTRGVEPEKQPLRKVLGMVRPLDRRTRHLLRHVAGESIGRQEYRPAAFTCEEEAAGMRVALLEDTWVTGAKAVSAAGALLEGGAASVLILPLARMVQPDSGFYPSDLAYFEAMKRPYDVTEWPV